MVRPERFERPTPWFVAKYSIQLSYGRMVHLLQKQYTTFYSILQHNFVLHILAEKEGFEPSIQVYARMLP
jgi:hypothetical protein